MQAALHAEGRVFGAVVLRTTEAWWVCDGQYLIRVTRGIRRVQGRNGA